MISKVSFWKRTINILLVLFFVSNMAAYGCEHLCRYNPASKPLLVADSEPRTKQTLTIHKRKLTENPQDLQTLFEVGRDYLGLANGGRWHYLDEAISHFKQVIAQQSKSASAQMMLGLAEGARALNMKSGTLTRLKWARQGFKRMDRAVALDKDCYFLRLLRGEAALMAHPILNRGNKLNDDVKLIEAFVTTSAFAALTSYQKARIELFLGNYKLKKQRRLEAEGHWSETIQLAAGTPLAQEAEARMHDRFESLGYQD